MHNELGMGYGQKVMNEGSVRQWCRMFTVSGQSSVGMGDLYSYGVHPVACVQ
jgi:hypothetical protein